MICPACQDSGVVTLYQNGVAIRRPCHSELHRIDPCAMLSIRREKASSVTGGVVADLRRLYKDSGADRYRSCRLSLLPNLGTLPTLTCVGDSGLLIRGG